MRDPSGHPTNATREATPSRDLAVSVFVVWRGQVLLHEHEKLALWLPPGGHVEPNELPDDAAVREVWEEAGVEVTLVGERAIDAAGPRQLVRPRGVQLEDIAPGHQHVDLVYWARPVEPYAGAIRSEGAPFGWYDAASVRRLPLTPEMVAWTELALRELG